MEHATPRETHDEESSQQLAELQLEETEDVNPADAARVAHARRREQVRRAQRKHRERKVNYVRALEEELHDLYRLIGLSSDLQEAVGENILLRDMLASHGIPFPHENLQQVRERRKAFSAQVEVVGEPGPEQHLSVTMPEFTSDESTGGRVHAGGSANERTSKRKQKQQQQYTSHKPVNAYNLHQTQAAIDFVLSLEQPCLGHTRHSTIDPSLPSGHAMTLQGILLSDLPQSSFKQKDVQNASEEQPLSAEVHWTTSALELERLFQLAGSLGLDESGFLTPVQAWKRITIHPRFGDMTPQQLETLRDAMKAYIRCFGFGAVMEECLFHDLLDNVLSSDGN